MGDMGVLLLVLLVSFLFGLVAASIYHTREDLYELGKYIQKATASPVQLASIRYPNRDLVDPPSAPNDTGYSTSEGTYGEDRGAVPVYLDPDPESISDNDTTVSIRGKDTACVETLPELWI